MFCLSPWFLTDSLNLDTNFVNKLKSETKEWVLDAKLAKIFKNVAQSVERGQQLDLKEIGIKRTPYTKLMNEEMHRKKQSQGKY